jgi:hypothetical protein
MQLYHIDSVFKAGNFCSGNIKRLKLNPIALDNVELVFQNAAVMKDAFCGADILPVANHQHPGKPYRAAVL